MKYGPENVPVDKLPPSLFPSCQIVPLGQYNPAEVEAIASRPPEPKPMPEHWSESKKRQMAGLTQYGGRTKEGFKKSLANLPRKIKMANLEPITVNEGPMPVLPEGTIIPTPPTMVPKVPPKQTITGKHLRRCLSQDEARLWQETYMKWVSDHPEYDSVEDQDDLEQICMETVVQFRLLAVQKQNPSIDIDEKYNRSVNRKQQARNNLMANRRDKADPKKGGGLQKKGLNIALLAGEHSPEKIEERRLANQIAAKQEEDEFLNSTAAKSQPVEGDDE